VPAEPAAPQLLSVIELGGYPDFRPLYGQAGYEVTVVNSVRKAIGHLKRHNPAVIVAEFNFQSDFRDRTSSLESLLAVVQRKPETRVVIFYEKEFTSQFDRLRSRFPVHCALSFPVTPERLLECLRRA
jgi:DNA-binding NtrC family response regulator